MINDSVLQYIQTDKQLGEIAEKIQASKIEAAILFIDLCDSTQLKTMNNEEYWLTYIYTFIDFIENMCISSEGEVVKQIGDEILLTFDETSSCENFIDKLANSTEFNSKYSYKIAVDYGLIYKFDFSRIKGDPYGEIVDRCSRIAKFCERNTILCSKDYYDKVQKECYTKTINIQLKGFKATTLIYYRTLHLIDNTEVYYKSILNALNNKKLTSEGYKYEPRLFNQSDLYQIKSDIGLPFLVHYLLKGTSKIAKWT
jgi:class 3 adenylate cyclase